MSGIRESALSSRDSRAISSAEVSSPLATAGIGDPKRFTPLEAVEIKDSLHQALLLCERGKSESLSLKALDRLRVPGVVDSPEVMDLLVLCGFVMLEQDKSIAMECFTLVQESFDSILHGEETLQSQLITFQALFLRAALAGSDLEKGVCSRHAAMVRKGLDNLSFEELLPQEQVDTLRFYTSAAVLYRNRGEFDTACQHLLRAHELCRAISPVPSLHLARIEHDLSYFCVDLEAFMESLDWANQSEQHLREAEMRESPLYISILLRKASACFALATLLPDSEQAEKKSFRDHGSLDLTFACQIFQNLSEIDADLMLAVFDAQVNYAQSCFDLATIEGCHRMVETIQALFEIAEEREVVEVLTDSDLNISLARAYLVIADGVTSDDMADNGVDEGDGSGMDMCADYVGRALECARIAFNSVKESCVEMSNKGYESASFYHQCASIARDFQQAEIASRQMIEIGYAIYLNPEDCIIGEDYALHAEACYATGQYEDGLASGIEALRRYSKLEHISVENGFRIYFILGNLCSAIGDNGIAEELFGRCRLLAKMQDEDNSETLLELNLKLIPLSLQAGDESMVDEYLGEVDQLWPAIESELSPNNRSHDAARLRGSVGMLMVLQGRHEEALRMIDLGIASVPERRECYHTTALLGFGKARAMHALGNNEAAYQEALKSWQLLRDSRVLSKLRSDVGTLVITLWGSRNQHVLRNEVASDIALIENYLNKLHSRDTILDLVEKITLFQVDEEQEPEQDEEE